LAESLLDKRVFVANIYCFEGQFWQPYHV